ncbi:electron transport complex subunit RsxC [Sedimenticola sp.]|uniref:electron transport complex subunit RsxC n=1 Tax=Sedimenticola sp. TaxID=1940285 RepID=UPI003D0E6D66
MGLLNLFRRTKTFKHGVHPMDHKEQTAHLAIKRLPFAPKIYVPLAQHIGAPAVPLVKPGQEVVRGEPIAEAGGFVSVPMHAPVTGIVRAIDHLVPTAAGPKTPAIVIETYEAATQEVLYGLDQDLETLSREALIQAVQASGMVGLGGAAFPSHVKLLPPEGKAIETLIINGCECEPYLTCDHRVMLEQTDKLIAGIRAIMRATGAKRAIIGVEDNKLDAVKAIRDKLPQGEAISCEAVETKYPQGAEKMLINSLLNKEVPSGGLPVDIGVAVYNVGTLAQLGELIPRSRGLIERVVTVSGPGVSKPGNYLVPIGTPLRFLMEQVGSSSDANEVIVGGPMMGMTVASLDVPVTKGVSGVVVFEKTAEEQKDRPVHPCIRCGACLDACPINLNPSMLGQLASARQYETMADDFHLNDCFECGCCSYVCPSNIPLTQYFRIAKAINRETKAMAA